MRKLGLGLFLILASAFPAVAGTYINTGSQNLSAAWNAASTVNALHVSTTLEADSSNTRYSSVWDGSDSNEDIGVLVYVTNTGQADYTLTVTLQEYASSSWGNVSGAVGTWTSDNYYGINGWYYIKFGTAHTETTGTGNYRVKFEHNHATGVVMRANNVATSTVGVIVVTSATGNPVEGDDVFIVGDMNGETGLKDTPSVVTIDDSAAATVTLGSDSAASYVGAVTVGVGGKLQYLSTATVDHTIVFKGHFLNYGGTIEFGTAVNPIPIARTLTLKLNYSATLADGEYGWTNYGYVTMYGANKTYWHTTVASDVAAGAKSFTTTDTTGWLVGDVVVLGSTDAKLQSERVTITGISGTTIYIDSNGDGSGASPAFAYNHDTDGEIICLTRNIRITTYDAGYETGIVLNSTYGFAAYDINWVYFQDIGYSTANRGIYFNTDAILFKYCALEDCGSLYMNQNTLFNEGSIIYICGYNLIYTLNCEANSSGTLSEFCFIKISDRISQQYWYLKNGSFIDNSIHITSTGGSGLSFFDNVNVYGSDEGIVRTDGSTGRFIWRNSNFGSPAPNDQFCYLYASGRFDIIFDYCTFNTFGGSDMTSRYMHRDARMAFLNYNRTLGSHIIWSKYGLVKSGIYDSVTGHGGSGNCVVFDPYESTSSLYYASWSFRIPLKASTAFDFTYYIKGSAADANESAHVTVDINGGIVSDLNNDAGAITTDWVQKTVSVSAPPRDGWAEVTFKFWDEDASPIDIYIDTIAISAGGDINTGTLDNWNSYQDGLNIHDATGTGTGSNVLIMEED